jgi:hypothetical protein
VGREVRGRGVERLGLRPRLDGRDNFHQMASDSDSCHSGESIANDMYIELRCPDKNVYRAVIRLAQDRKGQRLSSKSVLLYRDEAGSNTR